MALPDPLLDIVFEYDPHCLIIFLNSRLQLVQSFGRKHLIQRITVLKRDIIEDYQNNLNILLTLPVFSHETVTKATRVSSDLTFALSYFFPWEEDEEQTITDCRNFLLVHLHSPWCYFLAHFVMEHVVACSCVEITNKRKAFLQEIHFV